MQFSTSILLTATAVMAVAPRHPMITPAPVMRRDILDGLQSLISEAGSAVSDVQSGASSFNSAVSSFNSAASSEIANGGSVISSALSAGGSAASSLLSAGGSAASSLASAGESAASSLASAGGAAATSIFSDAKQSATCISLASAILDVDEPEATGDLESAIESVSATVTDRCYGTAIASSLSSSYASYESAEVSWYASISPLLSSYAVSCPTVNGFTIAALAPCSTALSAAGVSTVTGTGVAAATGSSNGTSTSGANRVMAAGSLVGLVGIVALF